MSRVLNWPPSSQLRMPDTISPSEITQLLHQWQGGSREAFDRLVPLVHHELRVLAARRLRGEWRHDRLQVTAVVNETYLRLFDQREVDWQHRGHFFAIAAQLMRRVLLDYVRRQTRQKRGGAMIPLELDASIPTPARGTDAVEVLDLDRALTRLESLDPGQARIIELRFFGGLTIEETALALSVSPATVKREWAVAKGWLLRELSGGVGQPSK
jgi:RNA polymerase sigma-70 factor (ECF subfamily)